MKEQEVRKYKKQMHISLNYSSLGPFIWEHNSCVLEDISMKQVRGINDVYKIHPES